MHTRLGIEFDENSYEYNTLSLLTTKTTSDFH